jgi:hypothetical protein
MTPLMTPIIDMLKAWGLTVSFEGGDIKVGPKHLMSDNLRAFIRENKFAILEELYLKDPHCSEFQREGPPYPDGRGRVKCFYCAHLVRQEMCEVTKKRMSGISLLRECGSFKQREGG